MKQYFAKISYPNHFAYETLEHYMNGSFLNVTT